MKNQIPVYYLKNNFFVNAFTSTPGPELGLFRIRGSNENAPLKRHQIVLRDIQDDGHTLLVSVYHGKTHRLIIENASNPMTGAIFSYKHAGSVKKTFKPGEILSPPETHIFSWDAQNTQGEKVTVTLTLIPLFDVHGLRFTTPSHNHFYPASGGVFLHKKPPTI